MLLCKGIGGFMNTEKLREIIKQHKKDLQQGIKNEITSESDLARQLGVSRQVVNKWLNKECVTYDKLFELMLFIGMEVDLFIEV